MTVVSAPLYVFFGWLSDRVGRKPVMVGGMLLALVLYFPALALDRRRRQPGAGRGAAATPMIVETDPATCSVQFDPVGTAKFISACDIAKSTLVTKGISFTTRASPDGSTDVVVGTEARADRERRGPGRRRPQGAKDQDRRRDRRRAAGRRLSQDAPTRRRPT